MFSKPVKTIALLLSLLMLTACAAPAEVTEESCTAETPEATPDPWQDAYVSSPEMAEELARAELLKMQELGILAEKFYIKDAPADYINFFTEEEFTEHTGGPFISVRWYCDSTYENNWEGESLYSVVVNMEPDTGRLSYISIEAAADENTPVAYEVPIMEYDSEIGKSVEVGGTWLYHENFYDIFPEGMTLNHFCDLLSEYWEYDGWTLAGGGTLEAEIPLEDISTGTSGNYYVEISFIDGEEEKPMCLQIHEFPGRVCLNISAEPTKG